MRAARIDVLLNCPMQRTASQRAFAYCFTATDRSVMRPSDDRYCYEFLIDAIVQEYYGFSTL